MTRQYQLRGKTLRLIVLGGASKTASTLLTTAGGRKTRLTYSPRNALFEREDGTRVVRPFRGVRRIPS